MKTELVVALLLIMNNEIVEHRIQPEGMAQCLRRKRHAEREYQPGIQHSCCLLYTSPSPRDATLSRMPSSA